MREKRSCGGGRSLRALAEIDADRLSADVGHGHVEQPVASSPMLASPSPSSVSKLPSGVVGSTFW
jgi:hypothetical protein